MRSFDQAVDVGAEVLVIAAQNGELGAAASVANQATLRMSHRGHVPISESGASSRTVRRCPFVNADDGSHTHHPREVTGPKVKLRPASFDDHYSRQPPPVTTAGPATKVLNGWQGRSAMSGQPAAR